MFYITEQAIGGPPLIIDSAINDPTFWIDAWTYLAI